MKQLTFIAIFLVSFKLVFSQSNTINLAGQWGFQMDMTDFERAFKNSGAHCNKLEDVINLPGTTDENKKGALTTHKPINRLARTYEFCGVAWYQKEVDIPKDWDGKNICMFLERILWISSVYVDGKEVGKYESFSTPHVYNLSNILTPGKHRISIAIDNRVPMYFERWCHAFSEYTQTAWSGIVGRMELTATDKVNIADLQVYPNITAKTAEVVGIIDNPNAEKVEGVLTVNVVDLSSPSLKLKPITVSVSSSDKKIKVTASFPMGKDVKLWSEFSPYLYKLTAFLNGKLDKQVCNDSKSVTFGMREYSHNQHHFLVNGKPTFLRGTLECAVFPLTGYPEMKVEGWLRICNIVKSYGMNHIRFHSWCPPEEAFEAADKTGIYLQAELPCWTEVGNNKDLNDFLRKEMDNILKEYGNHPSFVQLCMGNELRGNFDFLAELVRHGKEFDKRHLYSGSTARKHLPEDEFYVSHVSSAGGITTYGARGPFTNYDLNKTYDVLKVPGVAHEVGQRAVFPNFDEMKKYTGVLKPRNFEVFKDSLTAHNMFDQAKDFFDVSGQMTAFLYKESIEALLRTSKCGGFQLLDLHDFPGQGTALVGILDPFWDSKGIITPEKFREFCAPTVPLFRIEKRTFFNTDTLKGIAELYHYGASDLKNVTAKWDLKTTDNKLIELGSFAKQNVAVGSLASLGEVKIPLLKITEQQKLIFTIYYSEGIKNSWEIWVYPKVKPEVKLNDLIISKILDEATIQALNNGKKVLLLPNIKLLEGKKPEFQNMFWCPIMFRWEPMTMGVLVKNNHPAFKYFTSEKYTNWQWWEIIANSKTMVLDKTTADLRPLVQTIDTYDRNLKEGSVFEAKVGKGKLLFVAIDFEKNIENRPASQQLLYSLKQYANSDDFNPTSTIFIDYLTKMFKQPTLMTGSKIISCDSYEVGNEPEKVIDEDVNSIWHTAYGSPGNFAVTNKQNETNYPHEFQIELGQETEFKGFKYTPRQDGVNGMIAQYEFYISDDGKNWSTPIVMGNFDKTKTAKTVMFEKTVKAKFIRFVALKGFDGQKWASMSEFGIIKN
ncbi:MAG: beta-glucuronidase [Bacteroidetes bacterium]|nr:beta-glucuronidase [Bacteroidota bacterium]